MQRRTFFVGFASTSIALPLAGCSGAGENRSNPDSNMDDDSTETSDVGDVDELSDEEPATDANGDVAEPDPITFEGSGSTLSEGFDLIGGFVAVDMEYVGYDGGRFRARLTDEESGDIVRKIADEADQWSGEIGETLDGGSYRLDIEADGEWSIEIRQPRPTSGETPPIQEDCKVPTLLGPYELDGELQITATHEGGGNFIVRAHDATADGDEIGNLLLYESGRFDGTETFSHEGLAWITVVANDDWALTIE